LLAVLNALAANDDLLGALKDSPVAALLASAVEVHRHRAAIKELDDLVATAGTTEPKLQRLLDKEWWVFGGRYVKKLDRRHFNALDEVDFMLVRADGGAHVIELKRADVAKVVVPHRNHFSVGADVNLAVNQAMNYLTEMDRQQDYLSNTFDIDCHRVHATVIIGHPDHNNVDGVDAEVFHQTIRSFNSHLSRVEVISYADLVASASNDVESLAARVEQIDETSDDASGGTEAVPIPPDASREDGWFSYPPPPPVPSQDDVPF
jgi:hypothetical protein